MEVKNYDTVATVETNYLSDFYENQVYAFNPNSDPYNSGYDLTKDYDEKKVKVKIPDAMFEPLEGKVPESPDWEEGFPPKINEALDKLYNAFDDSCFCTF